MARESKVAPRDQGSSLTNEQRIGVLLQQSLDNDTVFYSLCRMKQNLHCIDDEVQRKKLAEKFDVECPPFDKVARQRLMEQIRKVKSRYTKDVETMDLLTSLRDDDGTPKKISEIEIVDIPRFSLGLPNLDSVLGSDPINNTVGLPCGSVLIFGAPKGTGKTRLTVQIAAHVGSPTARSDEKGNKGVLYIQNEEKLSIFRSRSAKMWTDDHNILLSSSDNLVQQMAIVNKERPKLVIIDSINDTQQARFAAGIPATLATYKAVAAELGCSFWVISHVNGEGNIKGGTYAGHKVDIELLARRAMNPSEFLIECPEKNRYGQTGKSAWFQHTAIGVEPIEKERNRSFSTVAVKAMQTAAVPLRGTNSMRTLRRDINTSEPAGGLPPEDE